MQQLRFCVKAIYKVSHLVHTLKISLREVDEKSRYFGEMLHTLTNDCNVIGSAVSSKLSKRNA